MSTAVPNAPQHSTSMSRRFQFDFSSYCMTHTFMSSLSHVSWHVTSCMHIHARGSMQSHSWNFSGCIHGCPRAQFANCTAPGVLTWARGVLNLPEQNNLTFGTIGCDVVDQSPNHIHHSMRFLMIVQFIQ